jgi:1,2-phenylacetyl-CoA epoxidase PaaB subunit
METGMSEAQKDWPLYEIFIRAKSGLDHKHVGSLHATDAIHRGLADSSQRERWMAYASYLRPRPGLDGIAGTNFEGTRSLFD